MQNIIIDGYLESCTTGKYCGMYAPRGKIKKLYVPKESQESQQIRRLLCQFESPELPVSLMIKALRKHHINVLKELDVKYVDQFFTDFSCFRNLCDLHKKYQGALGKLKGEKPSKQRFWGFIFSR